jgi:NarL family two-component system response regulator LiaR
VATNRDARKLRVALVNDYELILRGLAEVLTPFRDRILIVEFDVATEPHLPVDVALFDPYGHARGGAERVRLLAANPLVGGVAVYAWTLTPAQVDELIIAGARAVLAKSTAPARLVSELLAIGRGETVISEVFSRPDVKSWPGSELGLTRRESEVAAFLMEGLSNRELGDAMCLSEHTVKSHLKALFAKTGVGSRSQAVVRLTADPDFRRLQRAG